MQRSTVKRVRRTARAWCSAWLALLLLAGAPSLALAQEAATSTVVPDVIGGVSVSENAAFAAAVPEVEIPSGILMTSTGLVLWERDADSERAMASTTKMMTALVAIENAEMSDVVTITIAAAKIGESGIPLAAGSTMTVQELLEATLVHSANNAAFALAEYVGGDSVKFVKMMNERAEELGLTHTHFTNPHGLDQEGHYTSARDLAALARAAMANEQFAALAGTDSVTIRSKTYENTNALIGSYEGATGVKTGFTGDAGYCVVASAQRNGIALVAVVLGAESEAERFDDAEALLDWGFEHYAIARLVTAESTAALVPVSNYLDQTVAAVVSETVAMPVFDLGGAITIDVTVPEEVAAPVQAGDQLGTLTVMQGTTVLAEVPLVASASVQKPDAGMAMKIWFTRLWRGVFGGTVQANAVAVM